MVRSPRHLGVLNASYAANPPLNQSVTDRNRDPSGERLFSEGRALHKQYGRLTDADGTLLKELREIFVRRADEIVDRLHAHLGSFEEVQPLFADPETAKRIRQFQRSYLLSLTSGQYDDDYVSERLRIGREHSRLGLDPDWYLATYGLYLDLLLPLVHECFGDDVGRATHASAALTKLMILDMQLVLHAYYGIRQKQAVEKSEQLAAVGELAASIAHEVRNPLAGMKGALEVLSKDLDPSNQEIVDELLAQIERLEHLVRDLLTYARPRALDRQTFDVHELLDRLLRLYKDHCEAQRVTVQRVYAPGTGRLNADPRQIEQVFLNLIHNALQAMLEGGKLTASTTAAEGGIEVTFQDSGRGIPSDELSKVHQPFFTTKHRGSGLGLPIVKKIVEAHGGQLRLTSSVGEGTVATVVIPGDESE
jgi:signal transduction histidine kinase